MAEALVSCVLQQLITSGIENSVQQVTSQVKLVTGVKKDVQKLKRNFEAIQDVLEDAEDKQITAKNVKRWLDQLKDVSYDMEDVLDEWKIELLKLKLQEDGVESASTLKRMVCAFISCFSSCHHVVERRDIALKIQTMNEKLDEIARDRDRYGLTKREIRKLPRRLERESTSVIEESELQGRDLIKAEIVRKLLHDTSDLSHGIPTISLKGMGGIGKTALAKLVFNDAEVQAHFNHKTVWVCVSDVFDPSKISRDILEGLDPDSKFQSSVSLNRLLREIRERISKEKVFLVLDDVWEDNNERWEELKATLRHCMLGSKILVTTRKDSVVRVMESSKCVFPLEQLSDKICWMILKRVAYMGRDRSDEDFEEIGREIAKKCKGLPLAAKSLGSLLREKESKDEWRSVLNSELWKLKFVEDVFTPLLLSYYDLPSSIRRCLLYCAIFPKDHTMFKDELIMHWKVQGYLNFDEDVGSQEQFDEDTEMELRGKGYFDYLAGRSFFQDFEKDDENGQINSCKMHDLIHDFVQYLTKDEIVEKQINSSRIEQLALSSHGVRHLRITIGEGKRFPLSIDGVEKIRSLLCTSQSCDVVGSEILSGLFCNTKCLRLLEFASNRHQVTLVKEIPENIGKLIHLRYLSFSLNSELREVPEAICKLVNLQYLCLDGCSKLEKLPDEIGKLINLKHLLLFACGKLLYCPKGIGKLTGLRVLDWIDVNLKGNDDKVFSIGDLENLDMLSGELWLRMTGSVDEEELKRAKLHNKTRLTKLVLSLGPDEVGQEMKDKVVQALNPPPHITIRWW